MGVCCLDLTRGMSDLDLSWSFIHLDLGNLLGHNHGVGCGYLRLAQGIVVETTVVLVTIAVKSTEHATTSASESSQTNLLFAGCAPILFLFLCFFHFLLDLIYCIFRSRLHNSFSYCTIHHLQLWLHLGDCLLHANI